MNEKANEFAFEEFRLDSANALLWRGHDRVALPPKPFEVLCCLVKRAGQLVTKDELLDAVWPNLHVTESSLSFSINALRIALGDDPKAPRYIETVTRRGYRFIAPISGAPRMEAWRQARPASEKLPVRIARFRHHPKNGLSSKSRKRRMPVPSWQSKYKTCLCHWTPAKSPPWC
jgi:DNA-binding winged helix-turn-helix (wHTH) protein